MRFTTFRLKVAGKLRSIFSRGSAGPAFIPSSCISGQSITFRHVGRELKVEADYRTPLYELVAEIVGYDCYELATLELDESESGVIVDAGGNVGVAAIALSLRFRRRVVSLEPIPGNCEWLNRNLQANGIDNVEIWPVAIGDRCRRTWLWSDPEQSVSAHQDKNLIPGDSGVLSGTEVDMVDIPEILRRSGEEAIALLKMDIEGGEHDVIESLTPAEARLVRRISLEVHDRGRGRTLANLSRRLEQLGYSLISKPQYLRRSGLHHLLAVRSRG